MANKIPPDQDFDENEPDKCESTEELIEEIGSEIVLKDSEIEVADNQANELFFSNKDEYQVLRDYIRHISKFPILTPQEEKVLMEKYIKNEDSQAGKMIILSHLRLVVKIAFHYKNYGINMMDIISEGNTGLMHALTKFDLQKENRFSTYAMLWIRASIQDFIIKSWSLVKVGSVALRKAMLFNLKKTKHLLEVQDQDSQQSVNKKFAKHFNVSEQEIESARDILTSRGVSSLEGQDYSLLNTVASKDNYVSEIIEEEEMHIKILALKQALKLLNEREKEIIIKRHLSENKATLEQLSDQFKVSKERIRQIEETAIKKLKKVTEETLHKCGK
jgi:RNA polymerase sigma-32 factor